MTVLGYIGIFIGLWLVCGYIGALLNNLGARHMRIRDVSNGTTQETLFLFWTGPLGLGIAIISEILTIIEILGKRLKVRNLFYKATLAVPPKPGVRKRDFDYYL